MSRPPLVLMAACFMLTALALTAHGASVPLLITKGTHYEVGRDMGNTFQQQIKTFFANDTLLIEKLIPWSQTADGKRIYTGYLNVVNTSYPQYVEEMQGIATGSGVPFQQIFLNVIRREVSGFLGLEVYVTDACSDILVRQSAFHAFGHNEDGDTSVIGHAYMVQAEIINDRPRGKLTVPKEVFTAYVYPGALSGFAFGFNEHGLAFSVNALYPKQVLTNKTGHYILNRAMLSASNTDEVITILRDAGVGSAYGSSVNVADLHSQSLYNIEVAPLAAQASSLLDVKQVTPKAGDGNYFHVNMYRRINITEDPSNIISSQHRTARIEALPPPQTKSDILNILGDRNDTAWPIYRIDEKDGSSTLCTAYFNIEKWTMEVYLDNPAHSTGPIHSFDIPK